MAVERTNRKFATHRDSGTKGDAPAAAWVTLQLQLIEVRDSGRAVPCQVDPWPFTSDERPMRLEAARACAPCPVLIECARAAVANGEAHHVWGGVDLSPSTGRPLAPGRRLLAEIAAVDARPARGGVA